MKKMSSGTRTALPKDDFLTSFLSHEVDSKLNSLLLSKEGLRARKRYEDGADFSHFYELDHVRQRSRPRAFRTWSSFDQQVAPQSAKTASPELSLVDQILDGKTAGKDSSEIQSLF